MKSMNRWLGLPACLLFAGWLAGQEQPNPKTLIPPATIQSMVDEVSGTLAYQHILDLAGYEHDRLEEEYKSTYREAAYIEKMAKQYGMEDVHIERFKLPNKTWDGEVGELWLVTPERRLILSYRDIAAADAAGRGGAGGAGGGGGGAGGGGGRGGAGGALAGFYAQEARQFADGKRSVLEIRDAISAEFGPVDSGKVLEFFKGQAAAFELKPK